MATKSGSRSHKAALQERFVHKASRWAFDQDYIDKLSEDDKEWLGKFNDEWLNGHYMPETPEDVRLELENNRNARRRDVMSVENARRGKLQHMPEGKSPEDLYLNAMELPTRERLSTTYFQIILDDNGYSLRSFRGPAWKKRKDEKTLIHATSDLALCNRIFDVIWRVLRNQA